MGGIQSVTRLCFTAMANSFMVDYVARQKVGGTHINYFYLKQFPFLPPAFLESIIPGILGVSIREWMLPRVLELIYTAEDLKILARDCGYEGAPFQWDDDRRFEIRCELDAAFLHLYMPSESNGEWRRAEGETNDQLAVLKNHFPTPRHAVAYIFDQFKIVGEKDVKAYNRYRTKERVLEIYDAMLEAQGNEIPYQSSLSHSLGNR
jgi:hypothetical protein